MQGKKKKKKEHFVQGSSQLHQTCRKEPSEMVFLAFIKIDRI